MPTMGKRRKSDGYVLDASGGQAASDQDVGALVSIPTGIIGVPGQAQIGGQGQDQKERGNFDAAQYQVLTPGGCFG